MSKTIERITTYQIYDSKWYHGEYVKEVGQELVRCKTCVHYTGFGDGDAWGRCDIHGRTCQSCDYCSWGERKESE